MGRKRHTPEEIIGKLREAEIVLAQGGITAHACRRIGVTEQIFYRWRISGASFGFRSAESAGCRASTGRHSAKCRAGLKTKRR